jgi:hypothetical protein
MNYLPVMPRGRAATPERVRKLLEPLARIEAFPDMTFHRVGLNFSDIERLNLTWIDGLETSSGRDLACPSHKKHKNRDVQEYLATFGARKVEANALLRAPKEALNILQSALDLFVSRDGLARYQEQCRADMEAAGETVGSISRLVSQSRYE